MCYTGCRLAEFCIQAYLTKSSFKKETSFSHHSIVCCQDMVSLDTAARRRKRERDRENQRQKRLRERDNVDELKRKNVSLEHELRFLRDGSDRAVQELLETVKFLRQKDEVLTKKLKRVDEFIKTWSAEDQDRSMEREFEFKPILWLKVLISY